MPITRAYGQASQLGNTPAASNPVINGGMDIWQRGTSFTPAANTATYTADRWQVYTGATGRTISRQTTSDTTNLPSIQYCVRIARDSGNTSTSAIQFTQSFESANSIPYAGKTVTMSFYARAGANYSAASGALGVTLYTGTGTDQNLYAGYTGSASPINSTATLTTTWQRFSYTGTVAATATEIAPYFIFTPVGTAGAADYAEITGVQIDVGNTALPYRRNSATLAGELAACQRYCVKITAASGNGYERVGTSLGYNSASQWIIVNLPVEMRVYPTSMTTSGGFSVWNANRTSLTSLALSTTPGGSKFNINLSANANQNGFNYFEFENNANGYVLFSAEL